MSACQLIDANGNFVNSLPGAQGNTSSHYTTIAVVGCQSGGKSTLLNHAFQTQFPVLDAPRSGRRRTTLGVWSALHTGPHLQVILDVEGTDSRERGEGAKSFESRTTLFALALADVVIVNMWAHDVGRYSAANYDLFETVFAHSVALRRSSSMMKQRPVRVIIVVRDHDSESNVADIRRVLMGDLQNIWDSLKIRSFEMSSLFDMEVVALPHMVYAPDDFEREVKKLAENITKGNRRREAAMVPLEGFDALAQTVWSGICRSTGGDGEDAEFTLDLPRHAALAAHFKVGEIVMSIFDGVVGMKIEELRAEIEAEWRRPVRDYTVRVDAVVNEAFQSFDKATVSYKGAAAAEAVQTRRTELGVDLFSRISVLRDRYLAVCRDFCMNGFEDEFRPMLGGTNGFERNARRVANSFIAKYKAFAQGAGLPSVLKEYEDMQEAKEEEDIDFLAVERDYDPLDAEYGLIDSDDEDEYSCERFKRDVMRMVEERKQLGELMLPGNGVPLNLGPKREPWWKGLLIRAAILFINYLQATQGQRAALNLHRKHEREFPPGPTF
ncbi:Protein SEY1-like [Gracilariopsis chorda]|uniref:Protein SEY1-like n=1 Tax=Gracilariopsis chorda TaxID=448386 RepID=A0A2V3J1Y5_9FLOR|nr:Protein SEY1-like [Gracilariopsis chorda]|eukprot:PXF48414.1 Protein SEY1-like [Gracilariopsis chorda]